MLSLILALMLGAMVTPITAERGGNSAAAKACQKGGWEDLQRTNGTSFANQGACVSYAAKGGTLVSEQTRTVTVSFIAPIDSSRVCGILVEVTGFPLGLQDVLITSTQEPDYPTLVRVGADGTGTTRTIPPSLVGGTVWPEGDTVIATVAGVSSAPTRVAC
jgi:hypothetical protein